MPANSLEPGDTNQFIEILKTNNFDRINKIIDSVPDDLLGALLNGAQITDLAKQFFESGDVKHANRLLDIHEKKAKQHIANLNNSRNTVFEDVKSFRIQANTENCANNYDKAKECYEKAINRAERSVYPINEYIQLLEEFLNFLKNRKLDNYDTEPIKKKLEEAKKKLEEQKNQPLNK